MKYTLIALPLLVLSSLSFAQVDMGKIIGERPSIEDKHSSREGGSGIGGGHIYASLLSWCNQSTVILDEAKNEGLDLWAFDNDKVGAIKTFYNGMILSLQSIPNEDVNFNSSITYKAVSRGIGLSQSLGVPVLINGNLGGISGEKSLTEVISFFEFYYNFISTTTRDLDKKYFVPYYARTMCRNCADIPEIRTIDLEREFITYTTGQISNWRDHFVKPRSNGEGYYSTIGVPYTLKGLAYLVKETSNDLKESLFATAFTCQVDQLNNLAAKIQFYLSTRGNDQTNDRLKLNKFIITVDGIIKNIKQKNCH